MQLARSRISTFLFILISLVSLSLTAPDRAKAAEGSMGRYVFEYCHTGYGNSGSLPT